MPDSSTHPPSLALPRLVLLLALIAACATPPDVEPPRTVDGSRPVLRIAAEWEPALGVLVRWPPFLPRDLLVELASDTRLYVLVEDDSVAADAERWFAQWGIDLDHVEFLEVPGSDDAAWTRDYGPHPVFTDDGGFLLADARYDKTTPDSGIACDAPLQTPWNGGWGDDFRDYDITCDDAAPTAIAGALGLCFKVLPFVLTGGNLSTDGRGSAISTCILTNENRSNGLTDEEFLRLVRDELGLARYSVIPNFEDDGIQHVDCLLKMLDDERLLVARPPRDHALFARYERFAKEHLGSLSTPSGRPYEILRLDTVRYSGERLAAYTNSLILNDVVYVPLFDVPQDEIALEQWRAALPGHEVKGFRYVLAEEPVVPESALRMYPDGRGWCDFDALHCRTRAVWDPEMLHVVVDGIPPSPSIANEFVVTASIVPYSGMPLLADELSVCWRVAGAERWQERALERGADGRFRAAVPPGRPGEPVEYYVVAADASGRTETAPRTAPAAVYRFTPKR